MAAALAKLGLDQLRQQGAPARSAAFNAVVSPLSLASALGMLHAATRDAGARELASLLGTPTDGERIYESALPALLRRAVKAGEAGAGLVSANRVWTNESIAANVTASYAAALKERFAGDVASVSFGQAAKASRTINDWVSLKTAGRITQLVTAGALSSDTQVVVTNAIHFNGQWAQPFAPAAPVPFHLPDGVTRDVPTLVGERELRFAHLDGALVIELPFAGTSLSLLVGVPPVGRSLQQFEAELKGLDIAGWSARLGQPSLCFLYLPKFDLAPVIQDLTPALQALGVKTLFGAGADLTPMLGSAGRGVKLHAVLQSATLKIDEKGGEAAAATAARTLSVGPAAARPPTPLCAVDRPFLFMLMHGPSGTPLFMGQVVDPSLR
jgi:serpin B